MKRKKNFVLACLMMIVILSACGTKKEVESTNAVTTDVRLKQKQKRLQTQKTERLTLYWVKIFL